VIVKEVVNKSNHPIQSPLLLITEPRIRDSIKYEGYPESKDTSPVKMQRFFSEMAVLLCEIGTV
jgi:hypothetical protein